MVILETERLRFRQLTWGDLDPLYGFYSDPEIMLYFPGQVRSYETTQELLRGILNDYTSYGYGLWAAIFKSNEQLIGRCGLIPVEEGTEGEIAWLFAKAYWGQGLGTESAIALVRYGFEVLGLKRIFAKQIPPIILQSTS